MLALKKMLNNRQFIISLMLSFFVLLFFYLFHNYYYYLPDDVVINNILSGVIHGGIPSASIIYCNYILGLLISSIYKIFPNTINFYELYLVFLLFISFASIYYIILKKSKYFWIVPLCVVFESYCSFVFTFTTISYISVISGLLVFIYNLPLKKKSLYVLSFLLLYNSFLLRKDAFLSGFIIALFLLFYNFSKNNKKQYGIFFIILFGVTFFSYIFSNYQYTNSDYKKEYINWNNSRSNIVDYKPINYADKQKELNKLGISSNDYNYLLSWKFADKNVYSTDTLKKIDSFNENSFRYNSNYKEVLKKALSIDFIRILIILSIFCALLLNNKYSLNIVGTLIITLLMILYLYYINRALTRITTILCICALLVNLLSLCFYPSKARQKYSNIVIFIYFLSFTSSIICVYRINYLYKVKDTEMLNEKIKLSDVYNYSMNHKDMLYVLGSSVNINGLLYDIYPINKLNSFSYPTNLVSFGSWDTFSDNYYYLSSKYNFSDKNSLFFSLINNEKINVIIGDDSEINSLSIFILENYKLNVKFKLVTTINDYKIYYVELQKKNRR
jgi:hypothetical protein